MPARRSKQSESYRRKLSVHGLGWVWLGSLSNQLVVDARLPCISIEPASDTHVMLDGLNHRGFVCMADSTWAGRTHRVCGGGGAAVVPPLAGRAARVPTHPGAERVHGCTVRSCAYVCMHGCHASGSSTQVSHACTAGHPWGAWSGAMRPLPITHHVDGHQGAQASVACLKRPDSACLVLCTAGSGVLHRSPPPSRQQLRSSRAGKSLHDCMPSARPSRAAQRTMTALLCSVLLVLCGSTQLPRSGSAARGGGA